MTDLQEMPAGVDLDRLVAERVMGWGANVAADATICVAQRDPNVRSLCVWRPSTDIAQAWEVVESMRARERRWVDVRAGGLGYSCRVGRIGNETVGVVYANGETAALAICRAALLAARA